MRGSGPFDLSRRNVLLGGLALSTAGLALSPRVVSAQETLSLGDHEITVFSDGYLTLPMNFIVPGQSEADIAALLSPHGLAANVLTPDCNVTLLRTGDRLALFDAGAGGNFQSSAGELTARLEEAGIGAGDITDVILTHAHPDHLWGILDEFDDPLYPEANVWVPQAEWDYWRADDTLAKTPDERKSFVVGAQSRFEVIEDRVTCSSRARKCCRVSRPSARRDIRRGTCPMRSTPAPKASSLSATPSPIRLFPSKGRTGRPDRTRTGISGSRHGRCCWTALRANGRRSSDITSPIPPTAGSRRRRPGIGSTQPRQLIRQRFRVPLHDGGRAPGRTLRRATKGRPALRAPWTPSPRALIWRALKRP